MNNLITKCNNKKIMLSLEGNIISRKFDFDNLRGVLIICVVLGHFLEIGSPFYGSELFYNILYSFHMPAYIFVFGYFIKYRPKYILLKYIIPYVALQTLYILFAKTLLHADIDFQYTKPYWLLWFLLVCIYYQLLIPLYDTDKKILQCMLLVVAIIVAILVGYNDHIGYYASLSRFFVFQPWFLMGYYYKKNESLITKLSAKIKSILTYANLTVILCSVFYLCSVEISKKMLYGSYSYESLDYSAKTRIVIMLIAFSWIAILLKLFTGYINNYIPLLTAIGQNTFMIFLMHGFVVKLIEQYFPRVCSSPYGVVFVTCVTVCVFGNGCWRRCRKRKG